MPIRNAALLADPLALAKWVALGLATLLFLFFMRRGLKRREGEGVAPEPTWLRELQGSVPLAQLEAGTAALEPARERPNALKTQVDEIAKTQPEQIAAQMAAWLKE